MSAENDHLASEVFAIVEEPVAQGVRAAVLKFVSVLLGHPIPAGTHPVLVEKETGRPLHPSGLDVWMSGIKSDLGTMSAEEFRVRYIDP